MRLFKSLIERRVFYIVGIYLGVILAAFEFADIAVARYELSDQLVDLVLAGMLSFLPAVTLLAWFHGAPGKDEWHRAEKVGIPLNVAATVALVLWLAPGTPSEAVSETRTAVDENGVGFSLEVARADLVERVAVFFLEPEGFQTATPWEAYGTSLMIARSIDRDSFISGFTLYENFGQGIVWLIKRAGFRTGLGTPVSLMQQLAEQYYHDYFVTGQISLADNGYRVSVDLYKTRSLEKLSSRQFAGPDLFKLVDQAASALKNQLDQQRHTGRIADHFPAEDLLTNDLTALELFIQGLNASLLENDADRAVEFLKKAVERDPNFAAAFDALSHIFEREGDYVQALEYFKELNRLSHKLTEVEKIRNRGRGYRLRNEPAKQIKVYEMWTELDPDNFEAWSTLGFAYFWSGNRSQDAIRAFEKSLELMPNQDWLLERLGNLYRLERRTEDAVAALQSYHELRPSDYRPLVALGDMETERGDLDAAADYFYRANLAQTDMVTPILRLAQNRASQGRLKEAFSDLDDAEFVAEAPRQQAALLGVRSRLRHMMGQPKAGLALFKREIEVRSQHQTRLDTVMRHLLGVWLYVLAEQPEQAEAFLHSIQDTFPEPFDFLPSIGWTVFYIGTDQYEEAWKHNQRLKKGISDTGREDLAYFTEFTDGVILREQGDIQAGLQKLLRALEIFHQSIEQTGGTGLDNLVQMAVELARTQVLAGEPENAIESLDMVLLSWPHHPEANLVAASAHRDLGDMESAQGALSRSLAIWAEAEPGYDLAEQAADLAADLVVEPADIDGKRNSLN